MTRAETTGSVRTFVLILLATLILRAQTFGNPVIELDEQLYRLIGERMLEGGLPYVDLFDTKPIGLFLLFAFAALVGGAHALSYQILAALFTALGTWSLFLIGRRIVPGFWAPMGGALLYILSLNLLQGEGGQASVFYTPVVALAAMLTAFLLEHRHISFPMLLRRGAAVTALMGLAIQLKYTVAIEGAFFGFLLLFVGWRNGMGIWRLAICSALWVTLALLPTLLAWGYYAQIGHGDAWVFGNFTSVSLRHHLAPSDLLEEFGGGIASVLVFIILAVLGWMRRGTPGAAYRFAGGWLLAALVALVAQRSFGPHYWIPLIPPLALLALPAIATMRRTAIGLILLITVVGQGLVGFYIYSKGDARTVARMAAAIGPAPNCIFVFDGFPVLYQETRSCLPSRFLFPNMLNGQLLKDALGVDPATEVRRILSTRPDAIIIDEPRWSLRNPETTAIVDAALAADYRLALREETGKGRFRLVYRRNAQ